MSHSRQKFFLKRDFGGHHVSIGGVSNTLYSLGIQDINWDETALSHFCSAVRSSYRSAALFYLVLVPLWMAVALNLGTIIYYPDNSDH